MLPLSTVTVRASMTMPKECSSALGLDEWTGKVAEIGM
jgi:hypothetical protein